MTEPAKDQTTSNRYCPHCGSRVMAGTPVCPSCKQRLCQVCGAEVEKDAPKCPMCGAILPRLCPRCDAMVKPDDSVCPNCGLALDTEADAKTLSPNVSEPEGTLTKSQEMVYSCQVCGRQDETLRFVSFPYVVSFLVVTFRRAFVGLWCSRHRMRYWVLSSLISSFIGWIGIPFGFIYTPAALFKLAKGGDTFDDQNLELLRTLADDKLRKGDAAGAIRCLEQALRLQDNPEDRQKLQELYRRSQLLNDQLPRRTPWPLFAAVPAAAMLGIVVGLVDHATTDLINLMIGESGDLLAVVVSWIPFVAMLFMTGLGVIKIVEWAIQRSRCTNIILAVSISILAALATLYGTQQGSDFFTFIQEMLTGGNTLGGAIYWILRLWLIFTSGGYYAIADQVTHGSTAGVIYTVILINAAVYYLWVGIRSGIATTKWQRTLAEVHSQTFQFRGQTHSGSFQAGWLVVPAAIVCLVLSFLSAPLWNISSEVQVANQAYKLIEEGKIDQALSELEGIVELNPDLTNIQIALAVAYMYKGEYIKAQDGLLTVVESGYELSVVHAFLAEIYYLLDKPDSVLQELSLAEELGANDDSTYIAVGDVYYLMRDFTTAEEKYQRAYELNPRDSAALLRLAKIQLAQGDPTSAQQACAQADQLGGEKTDVQLCYSDVSFYLQDYDKMAQACSRVVEIDFKNSEAHACLSDVSYRRGDIEGAVKEAKQALEFYPYAIDAQLALALAYIAQNELDLALVAAQEVVRINPKYDLGYYALGAVYSKQGNLQGAASEYEQFLKLYWDRPFARQWKTEAEAFLAGQ